MTKIKVTVEKIDGHCNLPMHVGDYFHVDGSKMTIPEGKHMCIWALQSMMPVFPIFDVKEPLPRGPTKGSIVDIERMVDEYYNLHDWKNS